MPADPGCLFPVVVFEIVGPMAMGVGHVGCGVWRDDSHLITCCDVARASCMLQAVVAPASHVLQIPSQLRKQLCQTAHVCNAALENFLF